MWCQNKPIRNKEEPLTSKSLKTLITTLFFRLLTIPEFEEWYS
jgi:hypothetical protein